MSTETVVCVFCGAEVGVDSTLSLKNLNGQEGYVCKRHDKTIFLNWRLQEITKIRRIIETAPWFNKVMAIAVVVRSLHTLEHIPVEDIYERISSYGFSEELIVSVRRQVEILGGPKIPRGEIEGDMSSAIALAVKNIRNATKN